MVGAIPHPRLVARFFFGATHSNKKVICQIKEGEGRGRGWARTRLGGAVDRARDTEEIQRVGGEWRGEVWRCAG